MTKKLFILIGVLAMSVTVGIVYFNKVCIQTPMDTKIVQILEENEDSLLDIDGVIGAGIARDENNHVIGIAIYVEDDATNFQEIPRKLSEFDVHIKRIGETSEFQRERMVIRKNFYFLIQNEDFAYGLANNDPWSKEEWNKNEYTVVEIEDGILHLECNNTGEVWGNAGAYQGKHIGKYDYKRKLLATRDNQNQSLLDYVEYYKGVIREGLYFLEAKFRINNIQFTNFSIHEPNRCARINLGITLMMAYNNGDIYGDSEKIYFDIFFSAYLVNETDIRGLQPNFSYRDYQKHIHCGYVVYEVKPEVFGEWVVLKIDLGRYINSVYDLIDERDIEEIKVIGFIVFVETSGCYVNVDYDYIKTYYRSTAK